MPVNVKTFRHNPAILRREQSGSKVNYYADWFYRPRAVVETAYLPALRRLGDVIDRCQGYDLDCSRALPGIQRCSSLSALLAEPLDTLFITTSSLQHLPYWRGR